VGWYVDVPLLSTNEPELTSPYSCISQDLPEDQCIFIRGFRVARTVAILPRHLRASAKPSESLDADRYDRDSGPDVEPISIPAVSKVKPSA